MSMPSSRLDVATSPLSRPDLSSSSICSRRSRDERAVVRLHQLLLHRRVALGLGGAVLALPVQLVEAGGQALGQPAGVHEDQRGAVLLHQLEQPRVHGRPDGVPHRAGRRRARRRLVDDGAELGHVVDRDDDLDLERLAHAGVDDGDRTRPALARRAIARCHRGTGRSPPAAAAWPTARSAAGAERRLLRSGCSLQLAALADPVVEPLEGDGQVAAALGGGQRVDLVDDHGLDAAQRLPRRGGEHQVERLGRGDEDVGRVADEHGAARRPGCRRCACRRWAPCTAGRAAPPPGGSPAAGCAGSSRRRRPAPAAATRRAAGCGGCARWAPVG